MEPLFFAVICGCNAGMFREALHEVYIPRIQRGDAFFAAKVLGAGGTLLSVLAHFFEQGRWDSPVVIAGRRIWPHAGWGTGTSRGDRVRFGEPVAKVSSLNRIMLLVVG
jgi:hypothetical protein